MHIDWPIEVSVGVIVLVAIVLIYRLINRDEKVWRTRWGIFVERDRYQDDRVPEPFVEEPTEVQEWPERKDS